MKKIYVVTGAAGFLGNNIVRLLQDKPDTKIRAFMLSTDSPAALEGLECEIVEGNVMKPETMEPLFVHDTDEEVFVIHCAGIVDIKSGYSQAVYDVNVLGTKNVAAACLKHNAKMVYISSVHAMPPKPDKSGWIEPAVSYDPNSVPGEYAKVKAAASQAVLDFVSQGLHACLIQPSGLIGPNDYSNTNLSQFVAEVANEKLPACVDAGYSFVDVRDAAAAAIAACEKGEDGKSYIAAGPTISMKALADLVSAANHSKPVSMIVPMWVVSASTPVTSLYYRLTMQKPLYTAFAVHTLETDSHFDTSQSVKTLGFSARPMRETISDTVAFQRSIFRIDGSSVIEDGIPHRKIGSNHSLLIAAAAVAAGGILLSMLKGKR